MLIAKTILRIALALFFTYAGYLHFKIPHQFVKIVPPFLPKPYVLVWVSGIFEILGGLGLLVPATRNVAVWGLVALLIAVFPANIYMAVSGIKIFGFPSQAWMAWARLPLQLVLILLVLWVA